MKNLRIQLTLFILAFAVLGVQAQSPLCTAIDNNNGQSGTFFDVEAAVQMDIINMDGCFDAVSCNVEIWTRPGTHVGFEGSSAGWTMVASGTITGAGTAAFVALPAFTSSVSVSAGSRQAFHVITTNNTAQNYTNGTVVGGIRAMNADLTIYEGCGAANPPFNGCQFSPRNFNGCVYYTTGPPPPSGAEILHNPAGATLDACTDFQDGDRYTDSGGTAGNYLNNELSTMTFCAPAGETISFTFTAFDVEASTFSSCFDNLTVTGDAGGGDGTYAGDANDGGAGLSCIDGTDAAGNPTLGPFTSAPGGCIDFLFDSDGSITQSGWEATINISSCAGGGGGAPCVPFDLAGPYCDPCLATGNTFSLACGVGPNALIQGIDVSGLPGPSFLNAVTYYSDTQGTNPTGVDVHIYCGPAGTPPSILSGGVPDYSELNIPVSAANDGACVAVTLTTPPTIDPSCGTMWIEIVAATGRLVYTPQAPNCNGAPATGLDSWLVAPVCGIPTPLTFAAVGFNTADITYGATFEEVNCAPTCDLVLVSATGSAGVTCGNSGTITVVATSSAPPIVYGIGGPVTQTNGSGIFTGLPAGTYTVDVVDQAGCATTATVTLIGDTTPPVITCPPGQTLTCFELVPDPITNINDFIATGGTYNDDCPIGSGLQISVSSVNNDNGGTNCPGDARILTRTYTIADEAGNAATCTQTFTYLTSNQGPVITSILPTCYKYCASLANPMATDITYTTDCSYGGVVNITGPQQIGPTNCPGTIYRYTYSVMDDCGRTSQTATRDFIIGNDGPTIQCPSYSLLLECGDANNTAYINEHLSQVSANTSCELGYTINHFPSNFNNITCNTSTVVTFVATDDCGRTATCTTVINISDNTAPVITSTYVDGVCNEAVCGSNLAFWFANWKSKVFAGLSATDACDNVVSISVSSGINPNSDCPDGTAETTLTWVASDNCGNTSGISYTFYVVPAGTPAPAGSIMGMMATEEAETVENVAVSLEGNSNVEMYETTEDGMYGFAGLQLEENYTVTPHLNAEPLNGVSSFDLVLIAKHILQSELLDSPYKIIAADINKSGSVSTMDIVELRKLILHINEEFPNNTSWRFIESAFIFPVPTNPFASVFPEAVYINGLTEEEQHDFVGVKVGDVNGSAVANAMAAADDRTVVGDLVFQIADQQLKAGETYDVSFHADNFEAIHGYQFSLNFEEAVLKFANVSAGELTNLNESNFGLTLLEKGVITTSWTNQEAQSLARNAEVFHVTFVAKADALLSEVLHVSSQYTKAEAYNGNLDLMDVQLRFDGDAVVSNQLRLYQNTPNPFKQETMIGFDLPEASKATLLVYDMSGKLLKQVEGDFVKGYNSISLSNDGLSPGLLHYQLVTPTGTASMKMILQ